MFGLFKTNKMAWEDYLRSSSFIGVNASGHEHKKMAINVLRNLLNEFSVKTRTEKNVGIEVELLKFLSDRSLVLYEDLKVSEVRQLLSNGGTIVDTYLENAMYTLHKETSNIKISNINSDIIIIEQAVNKMA